VENVKNPFKICLSKALFLKLDLSKQEFKIVTLRERIGASGGAVG